LDYYKTGDGNYDMMQRFVGILKDYAKGFSNSTYENYLLIGGTGLGKTHLSTAVAKEVIDRGFDVCYVTAVGMLGDFEDKRFGHGESEDNTDRYYTADLLIIDDLGTEMVNQFTLSCVYDVINSRINKRKCTIISTNLNKNEIEAKYNERIASRLFGEYYPIIFRGTDIRKQKRQ
jgi:DNA replication protein DnaC